MRVKEELFNKNGLAIIRLAQVLGSLREGDRLPTIAALAEAHGFSVGTTQYALTFLKEKKVIATVSRGHQGTLIEAIHYELLREYAGNAHKVCVMPLPYSLRYEGLAAAFSELGNENTRFNVAFMNGSKRRVSALLNHRYDAAVLSLLAAKTYLDEHFPIEIAVNLGEKSFVAGHVLLYRTQSPEEIRTIGIDPESSDQMRLLTQFLKDYPQARLVKMPYARIVKRVEAGEVDATLWNQDFVEEMHLGSFSLSTLAIPDSEEARQMSTAVLVVRKDDAASADFLLQHFVPEKVAAIQSAVLSGARIPEY